MSAITLIGLCRPHAAFTARGRSLRRPAPRMSLSAQVHRMENPAQGCVLVAPAEEYNHFMRNAVVFLHEWDPFAEGPDELMARGLIVDRVTAFEVGEMAPAFANTALGANRLFTGGDGSFNSAVMIHKHEDIAGAKPVGNGLFVGGTLSAKQLVESGALPASDFKFFFNQCEFSRRNIQEMIDEGGWTVAWVSPELVMRQDLNGRTWDFVRNALLGRDPAPEETAGAAPKEDITFNIGGAADDDDDDDLESDPTLFDFGPTTLSSMAPPLHNRPEAAREAVGTMGPEVPTFEDDPSLYEDAVVTHTAHPSPTTQRSPAFDSPLYGGPGWLDAIALGMGYKSNTDLGAGI